ncbi:Thymus-specific serine protease [Nymphon striatum]|nr:Thymus-specific serine protease [Nymphon striatum]
MMALMATPDDGKNRSTRLCFLIGFAFASGLGLGPLLDNVIRIDPSIVPTAFLGTCMIFGCFSAASLLSPDRKWLYLGGTLLSGLSTLFWLGLANLFLDPIFCFNRMVHSSIWFEQVSNPGFKFFKISVQVNLDNTLSFDEILNVQIYVGLVIMCGFVLYDTQNIVEKRRRRRPRLYMSANLPSTLGGYQGVAALDQHANGINHQNKIDSMKGQRTVSFTKSSSFLGHATANIIKKEMKDFLEKLNLPLNNMISLGSAGPNVNISVQKKMDEHSVDLFIDLISIFRHLLIILSQKVRLKYLLVNHSISGEPYQLSDILDEESVSNYTRENGFFWFKQDLDHFHKADGKQWSQVRNMTSFWNMTAESMRYLTTDQALADIAMFHQFIMQRNKLPTDTKWIAFGGSYPGSMVVWLRVTYPHLIHGSVASSAPVLATLEFVDYMKIVEEDFKKYCPEAISPLHSAFENITKMLHSGDTSALRKVFNLCDDFDAENELDRNAFIEVISDPFASAAQYGNERSFCNILANNSYANMFEKMSRLSTESPGGFATYFYKCIPSYKEIVKRLSTTSSDYWGGAVGFRQWIFQTCTEYGYYPVVRDGLGTKLKYYLSMCNDVFHLNTSESILGEATVTSNVLKGGRRPEVSNVIFVNGQSDPWHALSVLERYSKDIETVLINDGSHCQDMISSKPSDSEDLVQKREEIFKYVKKILEQ